MKKLERLKKYVANPVTFKDYPEFKPIATPKQLLRFGIFDGGYFNDSPKEVANFIIAPENMFCPGASLSREYWIEKGWIFKKDPLGWFQWYLRFWNGRRIPEMDEYQIKRWINFGPRHKAQVRINGKCDITVRAKQRQGLLHWAHNPIPDIIDG